MSKSIYETVCNNVYMLNKISCDRKAPEHCVRIFNSKFYPNFKTSALIKKIPDDRNFMPTNGKYEKILDNFFNIYRPDLVNWSANSFSFGDLIIIQCVSNNFGSSDPYAEKHIIFLSPDNGITWESIQNVSFVDADINGNIIYYSYDYQAYFITPDCFKTQRAIMNSNVLNYVLSIKNNKIYYTQAGSSSENYNSLLVISSDFGHTWVTKTSSISGLPVVSTTGNYVMTNTGNIYVGCQIPQSGLPYLRVSRDGGDTWVNLTFNDPDYINIAGKPYSPGNVTAVYESSNGTLIVVLGQGITLISHDNGQNFKMVSHESISYFKCNFFEKSGIIYSQYSTYGSGTLSGISYSKDNGTTWNKITIGQGTNILAQLNLCGEYVYITGMSETDTCLYRTKDLSIWENIFSTPNVNFATSPLFGKARGILGFTSNDKNIFYVTTSGLFCDLS